MHAFLLGRVEDEDVALDLLQETFLRIWRNLASLQEVPAERQRFWIFTVVRNVLTDDYRKQATRDKTVEVLQRDLWQVQSPVNPDARLADVDLLEKVNRAIHALPEDLRTVLIMQVVGEMNSTQIGQALDKPPGTVRYQLAQARKRLAQEIGLFAN